MRGFIVVFIAALLVGCEKPPIATASTDNREISVNTLFTKDGCTVYRFEDAGRNVYFVKCERGGNDAVKWTQSCGKACVRDVEVPSV